MIKVVIVDDHPVIRDGLKLILSCTDDIEAIAEAGNGVEALELLQNVHTDIVLMDVSMPVMNGIEAVLTLKKRHTKCRVIILSMHNNEFYIQESDKAGAWGYVLKSGASQEIVDAIRSVAAGHKYYSREVADSMHEIRNRHDKEMSPLQLLSTRERQVMQMVVEGFSSSEIGKNLYLSPKTVDTYRSRLMQKLNVNDVPALVRFAIREGVVSAEN